MPVRKNSSSRSYRPPPRHRGVRPARNSILTLCTGALVGWTLAFLCFTYLPLMERHRQPRRPAAHPDPYAAFMNNSSSGPWEEFHPEPPRAKRIFCLVLTISTRWRLDQIRAVHDTWASDCDGLMFVTDRRLPRVFPSFVPALAPGASAVTAARGQYGALKTALLHAPFSKEEFDFYLVTLDSTFVAMDNLRGLLSRAAAGRPVVWGSATRSFIPGEGRVSHLSAKVGLVLSDAARRRVVTSDCGWPRQAADAQLSLCLRRLAVPQRHVSGFHPGGPASCVRVPPPPPPGGLLGRLQDWAEGRPPPPQWRPCPPRAVTFGGMNFATMRKAYYLMNLGLYGKTGEGGSAPYA